MPASRVRAVLVVGALLLQTARTHGQPPPREPFITGTTAVVVDVVVRDRKGAPVLDLTPSDFELFEDDVKQAVGSVDLVTPGRNVGAAGTASAASTLPGDQPRSVAARPATVPGPTVVALAFHRLSPEARALAHRAARAYLEGGDRTSDFAGVFLVDEGLATIQTYTNDRGKLERAIDEAASRATTDHARPAIGTSGGVFGDRDPSVSSTAGAESAGRPPLEQGFTPERRAPGGGADPSESILRAMAERMEQSFIEMSRDQQGHATINGLLALLGSLGPLPGRKTMVFFAEGLSLPPAVQGRFQSVIDAANRANVSIYTMDAAGLRVHSDQRATARGVAAIGRKGVGDDARETEGLASPAYTKELERNEFLLKQDPAVALGILAKETGGFFIGNTNDLASAFRRMDDDRRFHYLLTYTPANPRFDGGFRRIAVKVKRRGLDVRARSGYAATPSLGAIPVLRFESNALNALAQTPRPTAVALNAAALRFPQPDGGTRVAVLVALPASGVAYFVDDKRTAYQTHFTILARIVAADGEVVRKGSQPYRFSGPAEQVAAARAGQILFYRQPTLPAGNYTLEYALYDELSGEAGTGSLPLVVETVEAGALAMSDVLIVGRAERAPSEGQVASNPLIFGDLLLYPNLGTPIGKSAGAPLAFAYRAQSKRSVSGTLELRSGDGEVVATLPLPVPAPGAAGAIAHAAQLPVTSLEPGRYELRITLQDGVTRVSRSTTFELEP